MKKIQYIFGIVSVWMVLLGTNFKIQHWPGAGIMITLGIALLLFLFLPAALINNYRHEGSSKNRLLYIITYLTIFIVMGAALFKIQHWPFAGILILIALPFPFVVFLPVYLLVTSRIENFEFNKTVFVLLMLAYVSVFSALLSLNVSKNVLDSTLSMGTSLHNMQAGLSSYAALQPSGTVLQKSAEELIRRIDDTRTKILKETGTTQEDSKLGLFGVRNIDSQSAAQAVLFNQSGSGTENIMQLQMAMEDFKSQLAGTDPSPELKALANKLLDTRGRDQDDNPGWYDIAFGSRHLSWVLTYLEGLEANVYLLQSMAGNP